MTSLISSDLPQPPGRRPTPRDALFALAAAGTMCAFVVLGGIAVYRGLKMHPDWFHWKTETLDLLQTGRIADNTAMYGYLPGAFFLLMPFTVILPDGVGQAGFALSNLISIAAGALIVGRYWVHPSRPMEGPVDWGRRLTGPALLMSVVIIGEPLYCNQLGIWILPLIAGGIMLVGRGRAVAGGFLLGAAVVIKPIPGLLGVFCIWKGRWQAAIGGLAAGVLLDVVPGVLFWGWIAPRDAAEPADRSPLIRGLVRTVEAHEDWMRHAGQHGYHWYIEEPLYWRRGQSAPAVLARWLRALPEVKYKFIIEGDISDEELARNIATADGTVSAFRAPVHPMGPGRQAMEITVLKMEQFPRWNVADLSADTVRHIYLGGCAVVMLAVAWATRGLAARTGGRAWYAQAGLWILAMFWVSPHLTLTYFVWLYPVLALLCDAAIVRPESSSRSRRNLILACLGLFVLTQLGRAVPALTLYGINWLGTFPLGIGLMAYGLRQSDAETAEAACPKPTA